MSDRDRRFHEEWLGLAQPIEGLVFSVPVLADAQIAPEVRPELSGQFVAQLGGTVSDDSEGRPYIRSCEAFFREFLGYDQLGMLVPRGELPKELSFYAPEGGQEIRPSYALGRGPFESDDLFAAYEEPTATVQAASEEDGKFFALIWDLTQDATEVSPAVGAYLDLDKAESDTGTWRYPPTAKFERLLRHVNIPIGLLFNGPELRLVYAPAGQSTAHLTFRVKDLAERAGRPVLAALELLLHARRAYSAGKDNTLEGLLRASRLRQADVTKELAGQVFEAVETLLAGFEAAGKRDCVGEHPDWLRAALEAPDDHFYQGVLSIVLRLVFLLYSEDSGLLPVEDDFYTEHLSVFGLYERLSHDAGAHPESMHHRFGAYGQLLALFRAVYLGVRHDGFEVPPRRGKLFDPNAYPFLEGGLPDWTAAIRLYEHRAEVNPPSIDDGTIYNVLHRLVVFEGQRLSYKALDVEQIGSVYESLMGYHVLRLTSPAVRLGKNRVWVETAEVMGSSPTDRKQLFKEHCGLNTGPAKKLEAAVKAAGKDSDAVLEALEAEAPGKKGEKSQHRAPAGRLVLQPGEERRRTGSHYTPRLLTETVVRRTLEPLLACLGEERTADQILQLKICDPAMGSGAFLVAACRQLADEVVQAWTRSGELAALAETYGDPHLHARRLVAQRCLYGVDKNAAAVELAKLSLWLVTLNKELPFTFLDHALRHGDSLVGLDYNQVRAFHWAPDGAKPGKGSRKKGQAASGQVDFCQKALQEALDEAIALRQELLQLAENEDPAMQGEKRRLLEFSQQSLERIRLIADVCVGAFFAAGNDRGREAERVRRLDLVQAYLLGNDSAGAELWGLAQQIRAQVSPFHWMIEFPEAFFEERPDPLDGGRVNGSALMDGVVGNPPFAGKNTTASRNDATYPDYLKVAFPGDRGTRGNCDLSAFFIRRSGQLLGARGSCGFIITKSIAEGDSRLIGLGHLVSGGAVVFDATTPFLWPGQAQVKVVRMCLKIGMAVSCPVLFDGCHVPAINSRLRPKPERPQPSPLAANKSLGQQGHIVLGQGFVLDADEKAGLADAEPRVAKFIKPYVNGAEVNSSPDCGIERWVLDLALLNECDLDGYPVTNQRIVSLVKSERDRLPPKNSWNREVRKYWWRFGGYRHNLQAELAAVGDRCVVTAISSKHRTFAVVPTSWIFDQTLVVFPTSSLGVFGVLQSRVHETWAVLFSSTLKGDQRYTPSQCLSNFPFPDLIGSGLLDAGGVVERARADCMQVQRIGLTTLYNALKDPSNQEPRIVELRRLHEEMDRAVLDAYGWSDIEVPPFCPSNPAEQAALQAFEDEVIDRLYVLNAERHREELKAGLGDGKGKKGKANASKKSPRGKKAITDVEPTDETAEAADSQSSLTPKKSGKAGGKASAKGRKKASGVADDDGQGDFFGAAEGES